MNLDSLVHDLWSWLSHWWHVTGVNLVLNFFLHPLQVGTAPLEPSLELLVGAFFRVLVFAVGDFGLDAAIVFRLAADLVVGPGLLSTSPDLMSIRDTMSG